VIAFVPWLVFCLFSLGATTFNSFFLVVCKVHCPKNNKIRDLHKEKTKDGTTCSSSISAQSIRTNGINPNALFPPLYQLHPSGLGTRSFLMEIVMVSNRQPASPSLQSGHGSRGIRIHTDKKFRPTSHNCHIHQQYNEFVNDNTLHLRSLNYRHVKHLSTSDYRI
jgi:hypothetical protein